MRKTVNGSKDRRRKWDSLQKLARSQIIATTLPYNEEFRVRSKMQRWKFDGPDAILAARIFRNFRTIGKKCRPCVVAAFFQTFWNGWPTTWRMRTAPNAAKVQSCLLGCSESAVDKIEHYLVCPVAWKALAGHSRGTLDSSRRTLQSMLLAEKGLDENEICLLAVGVYAIARTVQTLRECSCSPEPVLRLHLQEGRRSTVV